MKKGSVTVPNCSDTSPCAACDSSHSLFLLESSLCPYRLNMLHTPFPASQINQVLPFPLIPGILQILQPQAGAKCQGLCCPASALFIPQDKKAELWSLCLLASCVRTEPEFCPVDGDEDRQLGRGT